MGRRRNELDAGRRLRAGRAVVHGRSAEGAAATDRCSITGALECWLLTLTKCRYSGREARRIRRCYRSAIQHAKEPVTTHLCVKGGAMKDHRGGEKLCLSHKSC